MLQPHAGIVPLHAADFPHIVAVWEASVRATHHFVTDADIQFFKPLVQQALPTIPHLVGVRDHAGQVVGFIAVAGTTIEMLFMHPAYRAQGMGGHLLKYAIQMLGATLVDVNEQNEQAVGFYLHLGFAVIGWSAMDGTGKPFPLLHLRVREADRENGCAGSVF